jgi:hypothetical protein
MYENSSGEGILASFPGIIYVLYRLINEKSPFASFFTQFSHFYLLPALSLLPDVF